MDQKFVARRMMPPGGPAGSAAATEDDKPTAAREAQTAKAECGENVTAPAPRTRLFDDW